MKMLIVTLVLVMFACVLTSCGTDTVEAENKNPFEDRFESYSAGDGLRVYVDKVTRVCYLWRWSGYKGGLTVMLDRDGMPLMYREDFYAE